MVANSFMRGVLAVTLLLLSCEMSYITYELLPSTQYIVLILIYVVSVRKCKMVKHYLATQWLVSLTSAHFTVLLLLD